MEFGVERLPKHLAFQGLGSREGRAVEVLSGSSVGPLSLQKLDLRVS